MATQGTQRVDSHRLALSHFTNSSKRAPRQVTFLLFLLRSSLDVIPYAAVLNSVFRKCRARRPFRCLLLRHRKKRNVSSCMTGRQLLSLLRPNEHHRLSPGVRNAAFLGLKQSALIYTGCPGRNVPDFGRMFLKLKYTDVTKNTYIRS